MVLAVMALTALVALGFGLRTYRSFVLLRSAYAMGAGDLSSVRPWMTLGYVAGTYHVSGTALARRLRLPPDIDPTTALVSLARAEGRSPFSHVREVQEAIAELRRLSPASSEGTGTSQDSLVAGEFLAALLAYGYPALGLTLFLGALGLHLPSALAMVVAGSLAAQGQMSWLGASTVGVSGSVLGDVAGYSLGRVLTQEFLERRGRWIGLTPERRARVERLFERWGALTVVLSRSLLSFLSPAVNVLAGAGRYSLRRFLPLDLAGRLIWTSAYLGLGYSLGVGIEAAADFLSSVSGLLISLAALAGLGFSIDWHPAAVRTAQRHALMVVLVVGSMIPAVASAATIAELFERVHRSVVVIRALEMDVPAEEGQAPSVSSVGSGVLISNDGKILTAAHLVHAASEISVEFWDGQRVRARVVSSAPGADVALLRAEGVPPGAVAARLADSDAARIGEQVFIIGAPYGLSHTLTVGHLSGRQKPGQTTAGLGHAEFLQTDAAINKGNSGGPMFDMAGEVLGIVSHIVSTSGGFEGLGFAVAANVARELVLERGAPWHGIDGLFLSDDLVRILNLPGPGVLVQRVVPDSPGARLGLRGGFVKATIGERTIILGGDVILEAQGVPIGEAPRLRDQLRRVGPGDTLSVTIMRDGRLQKLLTVLP
ncbi:MAG: trypsin-like peptidase domain-containing protein [Candidatus Rokubacteria bacterium]|nr:trypsin-like peptidase domain-containing protein [Candidatus Rokubacteria bacterium]